MDLNFSIGNGIAVRIDKQTILLDPKVSDFISFVSHAHSDHTPQVIVKKPYCTKETFELIRVRDPCFQANLVKENRAMEFDCFSVKMVSSGHMLGATQVLIETKECSILYTGDFKLWQGLTHKAINIQQADVLIVEATYGKPNFKFPLIEEVREEIVEWVLEQTKKGFRVNLGGYPVGKSQEAIKLLNRSGIIPNVSETVKKYCEAYNKLGVNLKLLGRGEESNVFVRPMHMVSSINDSKNKSCVLTGWSLFRNYGVQGFPLSDHCDFEQLMVFVQEVKPKKVYCVHGYANELAKEIRTRLRIPAQALSKKGQKLLTDFK